MTLIDRMTNAAPLDRRIRSRLGNVLLIASFLWVLSGFFTAVILVVSPASDPGRGEPHLGVRISVALVVLFVALAVAASNWWLAATYARPITTRDDPKPHHTLAFVVASLHVVASSVFLVAAAAGDFDDSIYFGALGLGALGIAAGVIWRVAKGVPDSRDSAPRTRD